MKQIFYLTEQWAPFLHFPVDSSFMGLVEGDLVSKAFAAFNNITLSLFRPFYLYCLGIRDTDNKVSLLNSRPQLLNISWQYGMGSCSFYTVEGAQK